MPSKFKLTMFFVSNHLYWLLELGQELRIVVRHPLLVGEVPLSLEGLEEVGVVPPVLSHGDGVWGRNDQTKDACKKAKNAFLLSGLVLQRSTVRDLTMSFALKGFYACW